MTHDWEREKSGHESGLRTAAGPRRERDQERVDATASHAAAVSAGGPVSRAGVLALQRAAGNRAVTRRLGDRSGRAGREPDEAVEAGAVPAATASRFGSTASTASVTTAAAAPTLFGRRSGGEVQRYATSDSLLTDAAGLVGLGGQVGSLLGAVSFQSSGFSATVGGPLGVTRTGSNLELASQTYSASGTVKASGPKARVGNYEIGFLQTVYRSDRNFYYQPAVHKPGLLARVLPTIFGDRKKVSDTCSPLPVRDGDAGKRPWYGMETVDQFDKAATSTKTSAMDDTPSTQQPWTLGSGANQQQLVKTDGRDKFRSWLAVKDKASSSAIALEYADWYADYTTTVAFNKASPASSVVTPAASSGSKVTARGEGTGGLWPLHNDPVANDVAGDVNSTW